MEKQVGKVVNFLSKISVAIIEPSSEIKVGDKIIIRGSDSVEQTVDSMQINHEEVDSAGAGEAFGMKTASPVKKGDIVYLIDQDEE